MRKILLVFAGIAAAMPANALAHTKWFNPNYCVRDVPTPILEVFDMAWGKFLLLFAVAGSCAYAIDRSLPVMLDRWVTAKIASFAPPPKEFLRIGLGAFYLCLWDRGGIILTPELITTSNTISWLQLLFALCTLSWRTTLFAACGTCVLYGYALLEYGLFHMMDYPFFLGIAAYLAIYSLGLDAWSRYGSTILIATLAASMLWASVEKWAYWSWTMPIIANHDEVAFGFDHQLYIKFAGFCEFSLAFFLLIGRLFMRLAAIVLLAIFSLAIMSFGKIDAIGHLLIILTLIVAVVEGEQPLNRIFALPHLSLLPATACQMAGFVAVVGLFLGGYYGLHAGLYGDDGKVPVAQKRNSNGLVAQSGQL